jgi:hypothetical protein
MARGYGAGWGASPGGEDTEISEMKADIADLKKKIDKLIDRIGSKGK